MASEARVPLPGSERPPLSGARLVGPLDPHEPVEVTVRVRPRSPGPGREEAEAMGALPVGERPYVSREEYSARHGADPADLARVEAFARDYGLQVKKASAAERSVVLAGSAQQMSAAFGVSLGRYQTGAGSYRGAAGPVSLPADVAPVIEAVVGLDDRPHARPHGAEPP
jgi:kumamolisin